MWWPCSSPALLVGFQPFQADLNVVDLHGTAEAIHELGEFCRLGRSDVASRDCFHQGGGSLHGIGCRLQLREGEP
jgi:hypothetical protein